MNIIINDSDKCRKQFIALFSWGIVSALKKQLITPDDAWLWLLNLRTQDYIKENFGKGRLYKIIGLGTELDAIQNHFPECFDKSCEEIIVLCEEIIRDTKFNTATEYYLEIENN